MTVGPGDPLEGALALRLGVDASGVAAEITAKMTAAERAAVASGNRLSAGISAGAEKATVAQLRIVAATERLNKTLQNEKATLGQRASAQAAVLSAQQRYNAELSKTERATVAVGKAESRVGGFLKQSIAAGVGIGGTQLLFSQLRQAKDAAIQYQDVVAANDVVFGKQRRQLDVFKRTQADAFNLSRLQSEELANTFGSVFKTAGATQQQALEQGLELTRRAADVRSFRGGRLEDVSAAFRSALVGETEPIRRYGVLLDDARLRLRALDLGLVESTQETLPPAIKAQAAYAEILAQTSDAAGDVSRTADSAANKIEDQRQKAADARQELGEGLLPVISELATAGSELAPALAGVARGISAVLSNDVARRGIYLGLAAAGFVKLTSALNDFGARTAEKIRNNVLLARSYDAVATSAGRSAVAQGAAAGGGVAGGRTRGRVGLLGPLAFGAGVTGSVGAATGSGALNDALTIGGGALAGGQIGSLIAPGIGTAVGAGIGGLIGTAGVIFGGDGTSPSTDRTPEQIRAEMSRVTFQLNRLRNSGTDNATRGYELRDRQSELARELKAAAAAGRETVQVVDPLTGKFRSMTQAQIEAANASRLQRDEMAKLKAEFAVDPLSGDPRTQVVKDARESLRDAIKARNEASEAVAEARRAGGGGDAASRTDIRVAELRLQAARAAAAKDGSTPSERASILSAQQRLNDLRAKGRDTAESTRDTEKRIGDALERQEEAQKRVNEARKAVDEARGTSARVALGDARDTLRYQRELRRDYRTLSRRGVSAEALEALRAQEAQAPGTIDRIADLGDRAGRRFGRKFSETVAEISKTTDATARFFDNADTQAEIAGRRAARAYKRGLYAEFFADPQSGVPGITFQDPGKAPVSARVAEREAASAARAKRRRTG